jgi:RimJ/RimL family protein N-acetyltransferase
MELELSRCTVRSFRPSDARSLARHANSRRIWRNLRDRFPYPYTEQSAVHWIHIATQTRPECHFAITVHGEAIGGIGLEVGSDVHRRTAELGYWVGEAWWGRGIASEAVAAMTDYGFRHFDVQRIHAPVYAWNPASARVLEKAGYTLEGRLRQHVYKDGEFTDELLYAKLRGEHGT